MERAAQGGQRAFLVEHYQPGITAEGFREVVRQMGEVAEEMSGTESAIRVLHSTLVPEDETAFCVFRASSQAVVERAYERAGVPFERIVDAVELGRHIRD